MTATGMWMVWSLKYRYSKIANNIYDYSRHTISSNPRMKLNILIENLNFIVSYRLFFCCWKIWLFFWMILKNIELVNIKEIVRL